jgi:hypothetical protein
MALRRLHWQNSLLGEVMYAVNLYKVSKLCCRCCGLGPCWNH